MNVTYTAGTRAASHADLSLYGVAGDFALLESVERAIRGRSRR